MLHGDIRINDYPIGVWTAVRKGRVEGDVHNYECTVKYRNMSHEFLEAEFYVAHSYGEGALMLASKVLRVAFKDFENNGGSSG